MSITSSNKINSRHHVTTNCFIRSKEKKELDLDEEISKVIFKNSINEEKVSIIKQFSSKDLKLKRFLTRNAKNNVINIDGNCRLSEPHSSVQKLTKCSFKWKNKDNNNEKSLKNLIKLVKKELINEDMKITENLPFKKDTERLMTHQVKPLLIEECLELKEDGSEIKDEVNKNTLKFKNSKKNIENSDYYNNKSTTNLIVNLEKSKFEGDDKTRKYKGPTNIEKDIKFDKKELKGFQKYYTSSNEERKLLKFNNIYDSQSDDEHSELNYAFILFSHPESKYKSTWDLIIFLTTLISFINYPLALAFNIHNKQLFYLDLLIEILFNIDIYFNFETPYFDREGNIIYIKSRIRDRYIKGYFTLDFFSSFPITLIYQILDLINKSLYEKIVSNLHVYYIIIKWMIIIKMIKFSEFIKIDSSSHGKLLFTKSKLNRIFKSLVIFLILLHFLSCLWIFIGNANLYEFNNWIDSLNLRDESHLDIYIASLYFNVVTIFSIGYGDILSTNLLERLYNSILLIFGCIAYTFAVSSLSTLYDSKEKNKIILNEKLNHLDEIDYINNLDIILYTKIKQNLFLEYKNNKNDFFNLIESLQTNVKNELIWIIYQSNWKNLKFFQNTPHNFILHSLPYLKSHKLLKGETLFSFEDYIEEMYFVVKGCLSIHLDKNVNFFEVGQIRNNNHFGEIMLLYGIQSLYELRCKSKEAEVLVLKKEDFLKIKASYNDIILNKLKDSYKIYENIVKKKKLIEKLYLYEKSSQIIKNKLKKLDSYLFEKGFEDYYYYDVDFDDSSNYLLGDNPENIIKIIENLSKKNEKDISKIETHIKSLFVSNKSGLNTKDEKMKNTYSQKNKTESDRLVEEKSKLIEEDDENIKIIECEEEKSESITRNSILKCFNRNTSKTCKDLIIVNEKEKSNFNINSPGNILNKHPYFDFSAKNIIKDSVKTPTLENFTPKIKFMNQRSSSLFDKDSFVKHNLNIDQRRRRVSVPNFLFNSKYLLKRSNKMKSFENFKLALHKPKLDMIKQEKELAQKTFNLINLDKTSGSIFLDDNDRLLPQNSEGDALNRFVSGFGFDYKEENRYNISKINELRRKMFVAGNEIHLSLQFTIESQPRPIDSLSLKKTNGSINLIDYILLNQDIMNDNSSLYSKKRLKLNHKNKNKKQDIFKTVMHSRMLREEFSRKILFEIENRDDKKLINFRNTTQLNRIEEIQALYNKKLDKIFDNLITIKYNVNKY